MKCAKGLVTGLMAARIVDWAEGLRGGSRAGKDNGVDAPCGADQGGQGAVDSG